MKHEREIARRDALPPKFFRICEKTLRLPDEPGLSIAASNDYLASVKNFANWLVRSRRMPENPFAHMQKLNAETDRRRERRAAGDDDFLRLLKAAKTGKPFRGLTGEARSMLYLVATHTGFRASELGSLTVSSFDLAATPPTITIKAAYSKRRRTDTRPVRSDLAELLTPWLAELKAEAQTTPTEIISFRAVRDADPSVWPGSWSEKAAVMLRADLEAAELPYEDAAGRVLDFHALRHTFGTNLAKAGVAPKIAQELMRHSDINLTMMTYSHVGLYDLDAALDSLPALPTPDAVSMQATGTDFEVVPLAQNWHRAAEIRCEMVRAHENHDDDPCAPAKSGPEMQKPLQLQGFEADCEPLRLTENEGRRSDLNRRPTLYESVCLMPQSLQSKHVATMARFQLHRKLHSRVLKTPANG